MYLVRKGKCNSYGQCKKGRNGRIRVGGEGKRKTRDGIWEETAKIKGLLRVSIEIKYSRSFL